MVEKITISPAEVRGYGDIVSPKTLEDFTNYMSGLTESDGVYTLTYDETGTYLNLSASPTTIQYGSSTVFTAVLTQTGEPVEGETVGFYEGETLLGSDTTDSNGEATLTKSDFSIGSHSVKAVYDEVESNAVSVSVTKLAVTVSLSAEQSSIEYGANAVLNGVLSLGSGVTVTFYEGSTSLGTVTTSTGGAFSKTITSPSRGSHTYRVEYSGDSTHESASASVNVSVNKITSTITLAASTGTITYGQSVTLSGTVSVGSGASIKIYNGSTLVDTVTSGSGGAFLKSVSGLNAGSHTFKAVYDGDDTHEGVTSSNVSVTVNKATPTITFASDKSVVTYGDSFTLSGVLSAGSGASINIIKNQSPFPLAELTTGAGGAYSKTIDGLAVGTYNLFATSVADSNYNSVTSSTITVTVTDTPTPTPASIDLTGTKSILSYADSESSVLTATVLDSSDNPVEGVTVNLYNGSTLWDTLTTDSSGECSKTYSSAGSGDITFTAEVDGTLLTKTYELEDCIYFHDMTSADSTHWTIPSSAGASYSSNGMKLQGSSWSDCYLEIPLSKPYSVEFDLTQYTGTTTYMHYWYDTSKSRLFNMYKNDANKTILDVYPTNANGWNGTISQGSHVKIDINSDNVALYVDDDFKVSKTYTMPSSTLFGVTTAASRSTTWKNIKIKPL